MADPVYFDTLSTFSANGDFLGDLKNASITETADMVENRAILDTWKKPHATTKGWRVTWEERVSGTKALRAGESFNFAGCARGSLSASNNYSGTAICGGRAENIGNDGVNRSWNAEGYGELTIA